mgnify:CR=1 FL=1
MRPFLVHFSVQWRAKLGVVFSRSSAKGMARMHARGADYLVAVMKPPQSRRSKGEKRLELIFIQPETEGALTLTKRENSAAWSRQGWLLNPERRNGDSECKESR